MFTKLFNILTSKKEPEKVPVEIDMSRYADMNLYMCNICGSFHGYEDIDDEYGVCTDCWSELNKVKIDDYDDIIDIIEIEDEVFTFEHKNKLYVISKSNRKLIIEFKYEIGKYKVHKTDHVKLYAPNGYKLKIHPEKGEGTTDYDMIWFKTWGKCCYCGNVLTLNKNNLHVITDDYTLDISKVDYILDTGRIDFNKIQNTETSGTVEHIIPQSEIKCIKNNSNLKKLIKSIKNKILACRKCNMNIGNMAVTEKLLKLNNKVVKTEVLELNGQIMKRKSSKPIERNPNKTNKNKKRKIKHVFTFDPA
jgi:hypothetical protein